MTDRRIILAALAATIIVAGCGDVAGLEGDVGSVSFDYSGAESGGFSAVGARPADWTSRPHAAGQWLESPTYIKVFALAGGDQFFLDGDVAEPGSYPLAEERRDGTFYAEFALDVSHGQNTARAIYVLTSGTVTLDPPSQPAGRISGRFAGTARLLTGTATIQIADGTFDVPDNLPGPVD